MMKHTLRSLRLVLLVCVLLPCVEGRATDVFLEATRSEFQKIPIWVMGFGNATNRLDDAEAIENVLADVLKADLRRTQLFEVIERTSESLDPAEIHCLGEASVAEARKSEASVVTWGKLGRKNDELVMEVCAHDENGKDIAVGKRYYGSLPTTISFLRRMAHRWADELVKYYTGEPGMAQTRIAYIASREAGSSALYMMDYDGFEPQPVAMARRDLVLMPTWLPDRRSVLYTAYRRNKQEIVQLDLYSRDSQILVPPATLNIAAALSPDGQLAAYASATQGNSDIFTVNVQTNEIMQLTHHASAELSPTWSPDGQSLAFASDRGGGPQIYIMKSDGSHVRRLTFQGSYNAAPIWSPRGGWIAYVCRRPTVGFRLCRISPDGQQHAQITKGSDWGMEDSPSWAPDGRHLVFSAKKDGQSHLYMIHIDGRGLERLTEGELHHSSPDWSP